jgi:hypothetical protein
MMHHGREGMEKKINKNAPVRATMGSDWALILMSLMSHGRGDMVDKQKCDGQKQKCDGQKQKCDGQSNYGH